MCVISRHVQAVDGPGASAVGVKGGTVLREAGAGIHPMPCPDRQRRRRQASGLPQVHLDWTGHMPPVPTHGPPPRVVTAGDHSSTRIAFQFDVPRPLHNTNATKAHQVLAVQSGLTRPVLEVCWALKLQPAHQRPAHVEAPCLDDSLWAPLNSARPTPAAAHPSLPASHSNAQHASLSAPHAAYVGASTTCGHDLHCT